MIQGQRACCTGLEGQGGLTGRWMSPLAAAGACSNPRQWSLALRHVPAEGKRHPIFPTSYRPVCRVNPVRNGDSESLGTQPMGAAPLVWGLNRGTDKEEMEGTPVHNWHGSSSSYLDFLCKKCPLLSWKKKKKSPKAFICTHTHTHMCIHTYIHIYI